MINRKQSLEFAERWVLAWNSHDIEIILDHFDENVIFQSPLVSKILNISGSRILNKNQLKEYFIQGLTSYPDLHFQIYNVFIGVNSIVIHYQSVKNLIGAEVFILNDEGKIKECTCHYAEI